MADNGSGSMNGLYSRNFDVEIDVESAAKHPNPSIGLTLEEAQKLIEATRNESYQKGWEDGTASALAEERSSRNARADRALTLMEETLHSLADQDRRIRALVELDMAEVLVGIGERIAPDLFNTHTSDLLVARVHSAIKLIAGTGNVDIRIPKELAEILAPRIEDIVTNLPKTSVAYRVITDPSIEAEAVCVTWDHGSLTYDPSYASLEVLDALKEAILEMRAQLERI